RSEESVPQPDSSVSNFFWEIILVIKKILFLQHQKLIFMTQTKKERIIRIALGLLLVFLALNAFGGGYYAMAGAEGVPLEWLEGSPFTSYFIPGMFLFGAIGGLSTIAAIAVFGRWRVGRLLSLLTAMVVIIWLLVQIIIIGYVSWMQPTTFALAIVILILGYRILK
ncbi:MAG: hypothetical protein PHY58_15145, partial [Bacteroidales bacterium]|nr:hypothetical protein [Bacteroidales bacterium]